MKRGDIAWAVKKPTEIDLGGIQGRYREIKRGPPGCGTANRDRWHLFGVTVGARAGAGGGVRFRFGFGFRVRVGVRVRAGVGARVGVRIRRSPLATTACTIASVKGSL